MQFKTWVHQLRPKPSAVRVGPAQGRFTGWESDGYKSGRKWDTKLLPKTTDSIFFFCVCVLRRKSFDCIGLRCQKFDITHVCMTTMSEVWYNACLYDYLHWVCSRFKMLKYIVGFYPDQGGQRGLESPGDHKHNPSPVDHPHLWLRCHFFRVDWVLFVKMAQVMAASMGNMTQEFEEWTKHHLFCPKFSDLIAYPQKHFDQKTDYQKSYQRSHFPLVNQHSYGKSLFS